MKNFLFLSIALLFLGSCGSESSDLNAQLDELKQENENLKILAAQDAEEDSLRSEYSQFLLDIQNNLNEIRNKESVVLSPNERNAGQTAESIKADLQQLGALLAENKRKIAKMNSKLANSNGQMNDLEGVIRNLTKQAEEREVLILGMKSEASDMGVAFDELYAAYESNLEVIAGKNETIEEQQYKLNTAYYAFGSKKELKENNVISAEGGVIGIGKTKKLKDDFNKEYFTEINITEMAEISLGVKKAEIITTHPANSYELIGEGKVDKIKIIDAAKFWSVSKYLVVVTK